MPPKSQNYASKVNVNSETVRPGRSRKSNSVFLKTGAPLLGEPTHKSPVQAPLPNPPTRVQPLQAQQVVVDETSAGQRLDNFLIGVLKGVPKTYAYRIIRSGEVRVNKGRAQAQTRVEVGDVVRIPPVRLPERSAAPVVPGKEFPVLLEDDSLLIINKPAGTAVHGGSGVSFGVIEQLRQARTQCKMLELVHRLDRDTSGVLAIAKKRSALTALQDQFRQRETGKIYLALVKGVWPGCSGGQAKAATQVIDVPLHKYLTPEGERRVRVTDRDDPLGKRSVTVVQVVEALGAYTLLSVKIQTGRTHQIRVHLAHMGFPIVGDDKYGDFELNKIMGKTRHFSRMFLHAYQLSFQHPQTLQNVQVQAQLPLECQHLLQELKDEASTASSI